MFLSSVLVRSPSSPGSRTDTFASQRSEPSSMFTSETPICFSVVRRSWRKSLASAGERRSGSVTISTSGVPPRLKSTIECAGPVDAPRLPHVHELGGVLLEVRARDLHVRAAGDRELAAPGEREVVLADLVALGQVGIEVVLAVEDRALRDLAAEREPDHQPVVHGLRVQRRQRARVAEADGARARVRLLAERQRAAAEHLRARRELDVDLEADHRLHTLEERVARHRHPAGGRSRTRSPARARTQRRASRSPRRRGPRSGSRPEPARTSPAGIEIAGMPASGIGTVQ